jgi:NADPH-dependent 2,4-dienoyl-CoA reductase/sulfur reductase-like enzyme
VRTGVGVTDDSTPDLIRLTDGSSVAADLVLTCVGSTPAVEWLRGSGLDLGDGVLCDEFCAAAPGIWAVGDVANWPHPVLGRRLRLEHRTNATEQARAVAQNILGEPAPFVPVPFFWSDHYDLKIQVAGFVSPSAQAEVSEGDPDASSFVQTYSEHGRLVGVVGWNAARKMPAYRNQLAAAYQEPVPSPGILKQVACPACGGIVESTNDDELVRLAKLHTVRIHRYDVPEEHVRLSIEPVEVD